MASTCGPKTGHFHKTGLSTGRRCITFVKTRNASFKKLAKKKIEEAAVAMADVVPTPSSETLEEKKERKRLKKLAKKKIEEAAAAMGVMVPPQTKGEVKNEGKKINSKKDIKMEKGHKI